MVRTSGWVYVSAVDLAEAAGCNCELCGRITAEGIYPDTEYTIAPREKEEGNGDRQTT